MDAGNNTETLRHTEGTVILHISFAVKQDQELGREFVKCLKVVYLTLLHSEGPKLNRVLVLGGVLALLSEIGLTFLNSTKLFISDH